MEAKLIVCKGKGGLWMPMPPKYLVERSNLQWKSLVASTDMLAATSGSLVPSGSSHPFWKDVKTSMRDPASKGKRTTLILSCITIVESNYDF